MQDWLVAAVAVLALLLGLWWAHRVRDRREAGRARRGRRLGSAGEAAAKRLLKRAGYRVLEQQPRGVITLLVDDQPQTFDVRADALAERRGARWVVEIKNGPAVADLTHRGTRRQLIEYALAFDHVRGVLLVDVPGARVIRITLPPD